MKSRILLLEVVKTEECYTSKCLLGEPVGPSEQNYAIDGPWK